MNAIATTEKSVMKITYRRSDGARHSQSVFVEVSKFETDSFPVRVRHLRLSQTEVSRLLREPAAANGEESRNANGGK